MIFQKRVSLLQKLLVFHQSGEIRTVELRNRTVQKASAFGRLAFHDGKMLGTKENSLEISDEIRHFIDLDSVFKIFFRHITENAVTHLVFTLRILIRNADLCAAPIIFDQILFSCMPKTFTAAITV